MFLYTSLRIIIVWIFSAVEYNTLKGNCDFLSNNSEFISQNSDFFLVIMRYKLQLNQLPYVAKKNKRSVGKNLLKLIVCWI